MAVIVQYIVERNGTQKMTFTDKKEAEAYDKQLEIAENMSVLLEKAEVTIDDTMLEEISLFLAKNNMEAMSILKGSKPKAESSNKNKQDKPKTDNKAVAETENNSDPDKASQDKPKQDKTKAA